MSAPRSREMHADTDWAEGEGFVYMNTRPVHSSVRVLVQEIPGPRPFEAGDRVRGRIGQAGNVIRDVLVMFPLHGEWWFLDEQMDAHPCDRYMPLPREITRTIRVTGPEDEVEAFCGLTVAETSRHGHRLGVEVVR